VVGGGLCQLAARSISLFLGVCQALFKHDVLASHRSQLLVALPELPGQLAAVLPDVQRRRNRGGGRGERDRDQVVHGVARRGGRPERVKRDSINGLQTVHYYVE
jgi:hypothetical protein